MIYLPALDGLRAIAVLMVMVFHAGAPLLRGGFYGVDVFFVLSGFLITRLLDHERAASGRIDIPRFYLRRLRRLMPPLLLCLALYLLAAPVLWPVYPHHPRDALVAVAYLSDYGHALWQIPDMLRHTWSLAVEEHYYLLWPLVLPALPAAGPRRGMLLLLAYALATAWRLISLDLWGWEPTYTRFDTRLSGLLLGAALASWPDLSRATHALRPYRRPALLAILVLGVIFHWKEPLSLSAGVILAELATALVIVSALEGRWWLGAALPAYLGRLSYGLYLFHYPVMLYLRQTAGWEVALIAGSLIALVLAALSFHTLEAWTRPERR